MLAVITVAVLCIPALSQLPSPSNPGFHHERIGAEVTRALWRDFKEKYDYHPSQPAEEQMRLDIFSANVDAIHHVNSQNLDYTLEINEFAHLSLEEFQSHYLGYRKPDAPWGALPSLGTHNYSGIALADSVDWTHKNAVTRVKKSGLMQRLLGFLGYCSSRRCSRNCNRRTYIFE